MTSRLKQAAYGASAAVMAAAPAVALAGGYQKPTKKYGLAQDTSIVGLV